MGAPSTTDQVALVQRLREDFSRYFAYHVDRLLSLREGQHRPTVAQYDELLEEHANLLGLLAAESATGRMDVDDGSLSF